MQFNRVSHEFDVVINLQNSKIQIINHLESVQEQFNKKMFTLIAAKEKYLRFIKKQFQPRRSE